MRQSEAEVSMTINEVPNNTYEYALQILTALLTLNHLLTTR
jgi:hypothetical protein